MMSLVLSLVFWIGVQAQTVPTCQGNDLVGAADSCMQYYQCIDGVPELKTCPWGLYWNDGLTCVHSIKLITFIILSMQ